MAIALQEQVVEEFLLRTRCLELAVKDSRLRQARLCMDATVLAATVNRADMDGHVLALGGFDDRVCNDIAQLLLQRTAPRSVLGNPNVLREANDFGGRYDPDVGHTANWLMMMGADASDLCSGYEHT